MGKRLLDIWLNMMKRCYDNFSESFANYGGRGIYVIERWHSFENFHEDVKNWGLERKGITLDRIDNDGPYSLENCRAATNDIQHNNKRSNQFATINGITKTLMQWSIESGIKYETLRSRYHHGWSMDRLLDPITDKGSRERKHMTETLNGVTRTVDEWSEITGLRPTTIKSRIRSGYSPEEVLAPEYMK